MENELSLPSMPFPPRCSFGSATTNGKTYIVGGHINQTHHYAADNFTDVVDVYDIGSGQWQSRLSPRPRASQGFFLAAYGNYLYAIGGLVHNANNPDPTKQYISIPHIDRYDIANDSWMTIAYLPSPRSSYMAAIVNSKVYIIGGWYGNPLAGEVGGWFTDAVDVFDLETELVTRMPYTMPGPLRRAGTAVSNGYGISIIGGITNTVNPFNMALSSVLYFLPNSSSPFYWSYNIPYPTFAPGSGINSNGDIYIFGGWQGPQSGQNPSMNFVDDVYLLRSGSVSWEKQTSMLQKKGFIDVVNLNSSVFGLLGGALDPAQSGYQSDAFDVYYQATPIEDKKEKWIVPRS